MGAGVLCLCLSKSETNSFDYHYQNTPLEPRNKAQAVVEALGQVWRPNRSTPNSRVRTDFDEIEVVPSQIGLGHRVSLSGMGSGRWFKVLIGLKKAKDGNSKRFKGSSAYGKSSSIKLKKSSLANGQNLGLPIEDIAAIRIQTAFRAYAARKALRRLKGIVKLQLMTQAFPITKQATTTLSYLHSWSKIQDEVKARRLCMVTEGRIKQKKIESQQKLEAKLHDIEAEWCGGSETMDEVLARIYQREEAAVKRERAMAYAFSHQWRANCSQSQILGNYELGKANWGWSWKDRWIAARPWESRVQSPSPRKVQSKQASPVGKNINSPTPKASVIVKLPSSNGKATTKARRLSYSAVEEKSAASAEGIKTEEKNTQK